MAGDFAQRFDFLMTLTSTTNSALARKLSFDASYISRIRTGKRGVPLHQPFIEPAAAYLAQKITDPYQIHVAERAIAAGAGWPDDPDDAAIVIAKWLRGQDEGSLTGFERILERFAISNEPMELGPRATTENLVFTLGDAPTCIHYIGDEGKRKAVTCLLTTLAADDEPSELLLYSDESMDWLMDDRRFTRFWQQALLELVVAGSHIRILHTLSRNVGEMLYAIESWLPLYLTGNVESLYCPRIRDGICRRTLLIASGKMAVTSNSIENKTAGMANTLTSSKDAVEAYEQEFNELALICKPLVRVMKLDDKKRIGEMLANFAEQNASLMHNYPGDEALTEIQAKLPRGSARKTFDAILESATIRRSSKLPDSVAAFISDDGFTLISLREPHMALSVNERLLTASFIEFLEG